LKAKIKMSEFFLELFTEEIPSKLQSHARTNLNENFKNFFTENGIIIKGKINVFSTPNRLVVHIDKVNREVFKKSEEIKGPSFNAPEKAIQGFIRSNRIKKSQIFKKNTEKGEFYFYKRPSSRIKVVDLLKNNLALILDKITWNKSMKWSDYDLFWGRPLKSILSVFDGKKLEFNFHHLKSSNFTFIDKNLEEKIKIFNKYSSYNSFFKSKGIIIDHEKRKKVISDNLKKLSEKKNLKIDLHERLLEEVTNITEKPKILLCEFDKKYLEIPKEILKITMENHQKYFPAFDKKGGITNYFFVIANINDHKGFIKIGNERVIEARLNDAEFFWKKNKSQNMIKQVSKLKDINYFKGIGSYFDKVQRLRKLSSLISDEMLISKEKLEIASSICKVDLMSDLVGEYPELQGIMGGYYAEEQGFDKEVSLAVSEHYLPLGMYSAIPKKPYSIALSISDKLDSLVGFFGINLKPSSSKDPYALRRMAIGVVRLILENNINFKLKELISYSCKLYKEQNFEFDEKKLQKELAEFIIERYKNYLKERKVRNDIIESSSSLSNINQLLMVFKKTITLNKNIKKEIGLDVIYIYKRSSSILSNELNNNEIIGTADPGLLKNEYEKNLYKKITKIRSYLLNRETSDNHEESLKMLSSLKNDVVEFFDNVVVNDDDPVIKKNRLELLKMLCISFENYLNFSKIEA
tara:strand:+ start:1688 stop:3766 length:2079 start_codon:yes stop_codon:yes gene_type:complete